MYVLGTAGHVDHGKSTLVKALTGIDPDRWEEEQRREMTIDLGFAWRTLPSGRSISLVDVPGHERFIKNMLAGVGGIDAALLVIAVDESFMPQTVEHLAILDLLGIEHGVVVLTKTDLADAEWLELVVEEVRERLAGTTLAKAPIVPVSARTGQGLDTLLATIDLVLDTTPARGSAKGAARLPIDRSFTVGGFGTVVTGTLIDGPLQLGDEVEILPQGLAARIRGLQSQEQKQELALPGNRVAVNLAGVSHREIGRGDVLARPGALVPTDKIDVQIRLIRDLAQPLVQNAALELFVGAAQVLCRATLLDQKELGAGEQGWLQLRLARPLAVARGDRLIVRQPSPSRTIGGGTIVDPHPARHRRFRAETVRRLESLARGTPADLLRPVIADNLLHIWVDALTLGGLDEATAREGLAELVERGEVVVVDTETRKHREGQNTVSLPPLLLVAPSGWHAIREKLVATLRGYHRRYPLRQGIPREDLRSRMKLGVAELDGVVQASNDLVTLNERLVWLNEHAPGLDQAQERAVRRQLGELRATPYSPPTLELDAEVLAFLVEQGTLTRAGDLFFLSTTYAELVGWVAEQIDGAGSVTVAQFRDQFATSRRYALALLEHLDERRITRREGEGRVRY